MENDNVLNFENFTVWKSGDKVMDNVNMSVADSDSLLLIYGKNKGALQSILSLDIDKDIDLYGKIEYHGKDVVREIKNIKRYSDKDKNLMKVSEILKDIFVIQEE